MNRGQAPGRALRCPKFVQALALALAFVPAPRAEARQELVPGSRYTAARAAAMGDAFLPLGEDGASALFYNPAAVGRIRKPQGEPMNFSVHANGGYTDKLGLDFYKVTSLDSYSAHLRENPGVSEGVGAAILPTFAGPGYAVGLLMQSQLHGVIDQEGNARYRGLYQFIPAAAVGARLAGGVVRVGYGVQWVNQAKGDISVPAGGGTLGYDQNLPKGSGFSQTAGFALTLPIAYLPSFNLVARNILGAKFNSFSLLPVASSTPGAPATEPMTVDASVSFQPKLGSGAYMNVVLQYRDATGRSGVSMLGRGAAGMELSFRDKFFLRGGWGSGYPSAGVGLRRKDGEFSFAWYSQEIGYSYHDERDVRYMFQFQVRAF